MVTSNVSSWEATCLGDVNTILKTSLHHDGKIQESHASAIRLWIAVASACAFPVLVAILSYSVIPFAMHNKDVVLGV